MDSVEVSKVMTLGQKQRLFTKLTAQLILHAYDLGYELTYGDAFRDPALAGFKKTLHGKRLALDLNLFKDGKFLKNSEDHAPLGVYWKTLHPLCRWGGDFKGPKGPDGNHYSIEHEGVK